MKDRTAKLIEKAFFEAERASWLFTAPNPCVGALALADGHIVGYGHTQGFGGAHAEEQALRDASAWDLAENRAKAGIVDQMVVTLEPCSATIGKKRPPCSQALLDAGVKNLVVAAIDPDPRHAGLGLQQLREAGLEVEVAEAWGQARFEAQNPAFLRHLRHADRPWVLLKWASSLDGKIASDEGVSQWISGPASRQEVQHLRALSDAVLCGKGTLLHDDPRLNARPEVGSTPKPLGEPVRDFSQPVRVLLGGADLVSQEAKLFQEPGTRIWVTDEDRALPDWLQQEMKEDIALAVATDATGLDLHQLLSSLHRDFKVRRLLVEGGAKVHGSFLAAGLADAIVRYEAPILLGGGFSSCMGPSFETPAHAAKFSHEERLDLGPDLRRAFLLDETARAE